MKKETSIGQKIQRDVLRTLFCFQVFQTYLSQLHEIIKRTDQVVSIEHLNEIYDLLSRVEIILLELKVKKDQPYDTQTDTALNGREFLRYFIGFIIGIEILATLVFCISVVDNSADYWNIFGLFFCSAIIFCFLKLEKSLFVEKPLVYEGNQERTEKYLEDLEMVKEEVEQTLRWVSKLDLDFTLASADDELLTDQFLLAERTQQS